MKPKMVVRNNIAMMKLPTSKKFTLPNARTFYAKYNRVKISNLPWNICIQKTYSLR